MSSPAVRPASLLNAAALVSLLVLVLSVAGLFALWLTNQRNAETLARLDALHSIEIDTETARAQFKIQVQEWKNLLLRGSDADDFTRYRAQFESRAADVQAGLKRVATELTAIGEDASSAADLIAQHQQLGSAYATALESFDPADVSTAFAVDAAVRGVDRPLDEALENLVARAQAQALAEYNQANAAAGERYKVLQRVILVIASLGIVASFVLVLLVNRHRSA